MGFILEIFSFYMVVVNTVLINFKCDNNNIEIKFYSLNFLSKR